MSKHFSANQFDGAYAPVHLCNWEVPKCYRTKPLSRKGSTKIISNDRGHLLPGIPRPQTSPWGNYQSTWQMPKRITRAQAQELSSNKKHIQEKILPTKLPEENQYQSIGPDIKANEEPQYIPGDLTQPNQHHSSRSILTKTSGIHLPELNDLYVEKDPKKFETTNHNDLVHKIASERISYRTEEALNDYSPKTLLNSANGENTIRSEQNMRFELVSEKPGESNTIPLIPAHCNFEAARRMAQENLEHQPLPDSIMDRTYLKMQAQGMSNPELSLNVEPTATGVGVKTHNAGPTHCTKLKVYRPKTCGIVPPPFDSPHNHSRPQTSIQYQKARIEPMDLAICWDYRPSNPLDEPKEPAHIDGSTDIVAPAIFNVVKTPRQTPTAQNTHRSAGVFSHTAGEDGFFDKDIMLRNRSYFSTQLAKNTDRSCKCSTNGGSRSHSAARGNGQLKSLNGRCQSSPNLTMQAEANGAITPHESIIFCNYNKEHYHYRPKASAEGNKKSQCSTNKTTTRPRQQNRPQLNQNCKKHENICCHHAGKSSGSICSSLEHTSKCSSSSASQFSAKVIRIPKPRHPYAKKNYTIDTLAPPFQCWKGGAGQGGYPDHWRLASVYQHAYKPPEQRKRPLLATVYQ